MAALSLSEQDEAMLSGAAGPAAAAALRIIVDVADILGAADLIPIKSAHIDGCLYHGDSGVAFAEYLVSNGARVVVPTTLNVGALDLVHSGTTRLGEHATEMARRMANAYVSMGCRPTWTCAPYQAGHRPARGQDVAWGESNAVVFCNSVLGARTNRYGDFMDICAALTGRVPRIGLHLPESRLATVLVDARHLPRRFVASDIAFPIIGTWLGRTVGNSIAAFEGLGRPGEDQLKALGAAAASSGSVGLFHVIGTTPEAGDRQAAFGGVDPQSVLDLNMRLLASARAGLSTIAPERDTPIDAVAVGSPHLSADELRRIASLFNNRRCSVPFYACTSRNSLKEVSTESIENTLQEIGVIVVADTCIVVTPILPMKHGVLVTNSGKFAHYTPSNTGYEVIFASLEECVESAVRGKLAVEDEPCH